MLPRDGGSGRFVRGVRQRRSRRRGANVYPVTNRRDGGHHRRQAPLWQEQEQEEGAGGGGKSARGGAPESGSKKLSGGGARGSLRRTAKRLGLIKGKERLSAADLDKLERHAERTKSIELERRVHLARTLTKLMRGGGAPPSLLQRC
jgi:hypothetical protein